MTPSLRVFVTLSILAVVADPAPSQGQGIVLDPNLPPTGIGVRGSGSADRLSPEVTSAQFGAADVVALGQDDCALPVIWSYADLGLPPGANVDAFSEGRDVIPPLGGGFPGVLAVIVRDMTAPTVVAMFSVDRDSVGIGGPTAASLGIPDSTVYVEAQDDGAASDTFWVQFSPYYLPPRLNTDYECVTPKTSNGPTETDIDALTQYQLKTWPVFYSIDSATTMSATVYGSQPPVSIAVGPADIVMVPGPGVAPLVFPGSRFGLLPGDDIDALAVDGNARAAAFSLTRSSPTVAAGSVYGPGGMLPMGGAGVFTVNELSSMPTPLMAPVAFGLLETDELNALSIGDPWEWHDGDLTGGYMCESASGATGATSVWRAYDVDPNTGYRVFNVQVGAHEVQGYDFDITVNLYGSTSPDPNDPKTLLASSMVTYPQGSAPGSIFDHAFDGVLCTDPYLWVEMAIPQSPNWPIDGAFCWAATDAEHDPTFYCDSCGNGTIEPLEVVLAPAPCLIMSLHGHANESVQVPTVQDQADLTLLHSDLFQPTLNWGGNMTLEISGLVPTEIVVMALTLQYPDPLTGVVVVPEVQLDLPSISTTMWSGAANNEGVAEILIPLPFSAPPVGMTIFGQALVPRGPTFAQSVKSNVLPIVVK